MTTTPITSNGIETVSKYMQALLTYSEEVKNVGRRDLYGEDKKYTALVRLAAHAEACQKTSTLVWLDDEGKFVAPNAGEKLSLLIAIVLDNPNKDELFATTLAGETVTLDDNTRALIEKASTSIEE